MKLQLRPRIVITRSGNRPESGFYLEMYGGHYGCNDNLSRLTLDFDVKAISGFRNAFVIDHRTKFATFIHHRKIKCVHANRLPLRRPASLSPQHLLQNQPGKIHAVRDHAHKPRR